MNLCEAIFHTENVPHLCFRVNGETSEFFTIKDSEIWCTYVTLPYKNGSKAFNKKVFQFNFPWLKTLYEVVTKEQAEQELDKWVIDLKRRLGKKR